VLRRIFGPKREEVAGGWRILHNEKLHKLYASPNMITVVKSRIMREGHVARVRKMRNAFRLEHLKGRNYMAIPGVDNIKFDLKR